MWEFLLFKLVWSVQLNMRIFQFLEMLVLDVGGLFFFLFGCLVPSPFPPNHWTTCPEVFFILVMQEFCTVVGTWDTPVIPGIMLE